jgi:hypothetical protein
MQLASVGGEHESCTRGIKRKGRGVGLSLGPEHAGGRSGPSARVSEPRLLSYDSCQSGGFALMNTKCNARVTRRRYQLDDWTPGRLILGHVVCFLRSLRSELSG